MRRTEMVGGPVARHGSWRLGPLGFRERVEPMLRRLVGAYLGVPSGWLRPEVSFSDDLAATPSDVTELVVAAERRIGANVGDAAIECLGTYGDFVDALVAGRIGDDEPPPVVLVRTLLVPSRRDRRGVVARVVRSVPYALDAVVDDARRAGPGARLDVVVPAAAPADVVSRLERSFAPLASRGVTVRVQHEPVGRGRAVA